MQPRETTQSSPTRPSSRPASRAACEHERQREHERRERVEVIELHRQVEQVGGHRSRERGRHPPPARPPPPPPARPARPPPPPPARRRPVSVPKLVPPRGARRGSEGRRRR